MSSHNKKQNIPLALEEIPYTPNTWRLKTDHDVLGMITQEDDHYLARSGETPVGGKFHTADDAVEALIAEYNLHRHNG